MNLRNLIYWQFAILLFASVSCTNNANTDGDSSVLKTNSKQVTINFIGHWYGEGKRELLVRDVAKEYEFLNQEVKINLKFPDELYYDRSDFLSNQKFVAQIVKEENPKWDIIYINNAYQQVADLMGDPEWARKYLVDFSQYDIFNERHLPELIGDSVKKIWRGIIPGPFIEGANWALWCNYSVAAKLGIEVKQFDMTVTDLISYAKAVNNYNANHDSKIILFYESANWKTMNTMALQLFASLCSGTDEFLNTEVSDQKIAYWYKTLQILEELAEYNVMIPAEKMQNWDSGDGILADKYLFFSNGSWMYNIWLEKRPQKLKEIMPVEYPVFKPVNIYVGGYIITWAVLKNSPNKDEAVKFLLEWANTDVAERWKQYTKCPTGIKTNFESNFGTDQFEHFTTHIANKYGTRKYNQTGGIEFIIGDPNRNKLIYYEEVLTGKMTADDAIKRIRASINR